MTRSPSPKGKTKRPEPADDYDVDAMPAPPKREKRKDGWPEHVPVLTAEDLVWNFSSDDGRHDIQVWLERTFTVPKKYDRALRTLCEVITERFGKRVTSMWLFLEFTKRNGLPSLEWQAACFNEMLARLGYEIPKRNTRDPGMKRRRD